MSDVSDCIVIGSGPSGMACAEALLERGRKVRVLDAGLTLEPERAEAVRAARASVELLRPENAPWLQSSATAAPTAIPRKLLFGSDFPYREAAEHLRLRSDGVGLEPSFAFGGHCNIWGAAVMPYVDRDIVGWPISTRELAPHYEACARMLRFSAEQDDLAEDFPLYAAPPGQVSASTQAKSLLNTLERKRSQLAAAGVTFGRARIAIRAPSSAGGCIYCGLCLSGCPDDFIFKTQPRISAMAAGGRLDYQPNVVVETVREEGDVAFVHAYHLRTRAPLVFKAKRVFVAGGPIPTTSILLRSGGLYNSFVRLKDSQYFLLPLLTARAAPNVAEERLHTLSQIFMEIVDEKLGHATTHLQIYSYNSLLGDEVRRKLGGLEVLAGPLLARLLLIQGYLHSDLSGAIDIALEGSRDCNRIRMTPVPNYETRRALSRVVRKVAAIARFTRAMPIPMLLRAGEPGRGFHSGGSFPMSRTPGPTESDTLGRPFGWQRVHAVDATVLPSVAATTITFTVMANAHRIGAETAALD
jgi:choline dehydrogenase-like flavoprotein